ncbi:MAG: helix-turn-helix domain-containing protein [Acidobacteriota bacterium]
MGSPLTIVSLFGATQGFCLAAGLFALRQDEAGSRRVTRVLAGLLICLSAAVAVIAVDHAAVTVDRFALSFLEYSLSLLSGPLFLLFARVVIDDAWPSRRFALHFLPTAAWIGLTGAAWLERQAGNTGVLPLWFPPIMGLVAYQATYTGLMIVARRRADRRRLDPRRRSLLGFWIGFLLIVHVAQLVRFVFRDVAALDHVVPLTLTMLLYVVSVLALRDSRLLALQQGQAKYERSTLAAARAAVAETRLKELMATERRFLDVDLDQASVAATLGLSRHHLSQLVNQSFGTNFNDFVNRYRVDEAAALLRDPANDRLTIEAIGRRAGFRSRSAFYEAYRRHVGESPSSTRRGR